MRLRLFISTFFVLPSILLSQEVDSSKLERIGSILCNCLENNKGNATTSRINDCGYVLTEGLSVIKSDSLKYLYSSKTDTYLQKNCEAYISILSSENQNSDMKLENKSKYVDLKDKNVGVDYRDLSNGKYMYRDFINDTIYVEIAENYWIERSKSYGGITSFSLKVDESDSKMIFLNSTEAFIEDYYATNEPIDYIILKEGKGFRIFTRFLNGIVLSKRLWNIKDEK